MELKIDGRRAIVTGASQGIGEAIAVALAAEGVEVVAVARNAERLARLESRIHDAGGRCVIVRADLSTPAAAATVTEEASARGPVDILVNNVGGGQEKDVLLLTEEDWQVALELNLLSAVRLCAALAPAMRDRGWGRIVNVASTSVREPDPRLASYAASKAALVAYTKALSISVAPAVLANCVLPGPTRTERMEWAAGREAAAQGIDVAEVLAAMEARWPGPMGRWARTDEVAAAVVFLCSEAASFVAGVSLPVDGSATRFPL